jgi:acetylornithine deacetylase
MIRLVGHADPVRAAFRAAAASVPHVELTEVLCNPAMRLESLDGLPTTIVSFGSDVADLSPAWGKPLMFGPGSIHLAHTEEERIPKDELLGAVTAYQSIAKRLLAGHGGSVR